MMKTFVYFLFVLLLPLALFAQERDISRLIDCPTAASLKHGELDCRMNLFAGGGVCAGAAVAILPGLDIGLYYGANDLIGYHKVHEFKYPGASVSYRFLNRKEWAPALSAGFNMQGNGPFYDPGLKKYERFQMKAKGLWVAASNLFNVEYVGIIGAHFGLNWNFFENTDDRDPSLYIGFDKWIFPQLGIITEYDAAIDDNSSRALGRGRGYLNTALRWRVVKPLTVEFVLRDLLNNNELKTTPSRELRLSYRIQL